MGQETMGLSQLWNGNSHCCLKAIMKKGTAAYMPDDLSGPESGSLGGMEGLSSRTSALRSPKGSGQPLGLSFHTGRNFSLEFWHLYEKKDNSLSTFGLYDLINSMCNYLLYNISQFAGLRIPWGGSITSHSSYTQCIKLKCLNLIWYLFMWIKGIHLWNVNIFKKCHNSVNPNTVFLNVLSH